MFDPWTATLELAQQQPNAYENRGAVCQCVAAHKLTEKQDSIIRGDGFDVLQAVAECALNGLVMPDWLTDAYLSRYRIVQQCKADSWDAPDSFGKPYPKGKHISTFRLQREYGLRVLALFENDKFRGKNGLPRTLAGRQEAAKILGITEKQVRTLLPKTRANVKGHKPYRTRSATAVSANDPFSLAARKVPKK